MIAIGHHRHDVTAISRVKSCGRQFEIESVTTVTICVTGCDRCGISDFPRFADVLVYRIMHVYHGYIWGTNDCHMIESSFATFTKDPHAIWNRPPLSWSNGSTRLVRKKKLNTNVTHNEDRNLRVSLPRRWRAWQPSSRESGSNILQPLTVVPLSLSLGMQSATGIYLGLVTEHDWTLICDFIWFQRTHQGPTQVQYKCDYITGPTLGHLTFTTLPPTNISFPVFTYRQSTINNRLSDAYINWSVYHVFSPWLHTHHVLSSNW
jgi:hypothetical protein